MKHIQKLLNLINSHKIQNILFYEDRKLSEQQINHLLKINQNLKIYIAINSIFSQKRLLGKFRNNQRIFISDLTSIQNINYDYIFFGIIDNKINSIINSINYKCVIEFDGNIPYRSFNFQKFKLGQFNLFYNFQNIIEQKNQIQKLTQQFGTIDLITCQQNRIIGNQLDILRDSTKNYNKVQIRSFRENKNVNKIGIIVPTFNQSYYTIKCFKSIEKYCKNYFKIIIYWIDNGSSKQQIQNVRNCIKNFKNIKVKQIFFNQPIGFVKAINYGIQKALKDNNEYIFFQNNDTEFTKGSLEPLINTFYSDSNITAACPITNSEINVQGFHNIKTNNLIQNFPNLENKTDYEITKILHQTYRNQYYNLTKQNHSFIPAFFSFVIKSSVIKKIGILDESFGKGYGDDVDYCLRIFENGYSIAFVPESFVKHVHRVTFKSIESQDDIKRTIKAHLAQCNINLSLNKNKQKKYVVYMCVTGGYDDIKHLTYIDQKNFDYIVFSDQHINVPSPWKLILITQFAEMFHTYETNDFTRLSRYFKTHPHLFFKNYQKSLWIDGNIDLINNTKQLVQLLPKDQFMLTAKHPLRNCVYDQVQAVIKLKKDSQELINKEKQFLLSQNYPEQNGLVQSNVIVRDHHNQECKFLMQKWWEMIRDYSKRDQLSFNYLIWKYNLSYSFLDWEKLNNNYITLGYKHKK